MASPSAPRSALGTVVGWLLLIVIAWLVLSMAIGTLRWLIRGALIIGLVLGLGWLYITLKGDPPDEPS